MVVFSTERLGKITSKSQQKPLWHLTIRAIGNFLFY